MIDLVLGLHPPTGGPTDVDSHLIAGCSKLEPLPESPQSPPPHERGYRPAPEMPHWGQEEIYWPPYSHITGVAVKMSGHCGEQNLVQHGLFGVWQIGRHNPRGGNFQLLRKDASGRRVIRDKTTTTTRFSSRNAGGRFRSRPPGTVADCCLRWKQLPSSPK